MFSSHLLNKNEKNVIYITKHASYSVFNSFLVSHIKGRTHSLKVCREYDARKDFGHKGK